MCGGDRCCSMGDSEHITVERSNSRPGGVSPVKQRSGSCGRSVPTLSFAVDIELGKEPLGLDLSAHDGATLLVGEVFPGPVSVWNASRPPLALDVVRRGDRIVDANGVGGSSDLLLQSVSEANSILHLRLTRLLEFCVDIDRGEGESLGLDLQQDTLGRLYVCRVSAGPVCEANGVNAADEEVRPGDCMFSVNGCTSAAEIRAALSADRLLSIVFHRPGAP